MTVRSSSIFVCTYNDAMKSRPLKTRFIFLKSGTPDGLPPQRFFKRSPGKTGQRHYERQSALELQPFRRPGWAIPPQRKRRKPDSTLHGGLMVPLSWREYIRHGYRVKSTVYVSATRHNAIKFLPGAGKTYVCDRNTSATERKECLGCSVKNNLLLPVHASGRSHYVLSVVECRHTSQQLLASILRAVAMQAKMGYKTIR